MYQRKFKLDNETKAIENLVSFYELDFFQSYNCLFLNINCGYAYFEMKSTSSDLMLSNVSKQSIDFLNSEKGSLKSTILQIEDSIENFPLSVHMFKSENFYEMMIYSLGNKACNYEDLGSKVDDKFEKWYQKVDSNLILPYMS